MENLNSPQKFRNKYRIESTRLKGWDYSTHAAYFITICTKNREHFFGEIVGGELQETEQSKICQNVWDDLPNHYPHCILDAFVIMPNHVHGIIIIQDRIPIVETIHELSLQGEKSNKFRRNMLVPKIIGRFKMQTAKKINLYQKTEGFPFWQKNYHDRIIRNEDELCRIREYIANNPLAWEWDRDNPNNISSKNSFDKH